MGIRKSESLTWVTGKKTELLIPDPSICITDYYHDLTVISFACHFKIRGSLAGEKTMAVGNRISFTPLYSVFASPY